MYRGQATARIAIEFIGAVDGYRIEQVTELLRRNNVHVCRERALFGGADAQRKTLYNLTSPNQYSSR